MDFEYNWSKEDLKNELNETRNKTNIKFLIFGIVAFLYFTYYPIVLKEFDTKVIVMYGVIYLFILCLFLFISGKIFVSRALKKNDKRTNNAYGTYKVKLNDETIKVCINGQVIEYKYSEINKFKNKKKYIFINTKEDKIGLKFKKKVIGEETYNKLVEYIKNRISK